MNKHRLLKLAQLLQSAGYHKKAAEIKKIATYRNLGRPNDIDLESFFGKQDKQDKQDEQDTLENTMVNGLINEIKETLDDLRTPAARRIFLQGVEIPKYLSKDDKSTIRKLINSLLDDLDKETRWNRAKDHK